MLETLAFQHTHAHARTNTNCDKGTYNHMHVRAQASARNTFKVAGGNADKGVGLYNISQPNLIKKLLEACGRCPTIHILAHTGQLLWVGTTFYVTQIITNSQTHNLVGQ